MQENAKEELDLAREQATKLFEFQQKAFDSDEEMKAFSRQVGQTQMDAMNLQMDYAQKDRERYESVFLPMQDRMIKEANEYDTPERREAEASRAQVDIQRQSEAARNNADARLRSMGIDPSQMRSQSLLQTQDVGMAATTALAGNAARTNVEDKGRALRADALNIGMGLPSQAAAGFQGSNASGAGAINSASAGQQATLGAIQAGAGVGGTAMGFRSGALQNLSNLTGSPTQWAGMGGNMLGQASSAYGNAANTSSQNYQNQMSSWKAGQEQAQQSFNNIMSVASLAGGMMMAEGGDVSKKAKATGALPIAKEAINVVRGTKYDPGEVLVSKPTINTAPARPTMTERVDNGAAMQAKYGSAGNVWEGQTSSDPRIQVQQTQLGGDNMQYAAEGGRTHALPVRQARDKFNAVLSEGEYIIPADVVRSVGLRHLDSMVKKYHRENA